MPDFQDTMKILNSIDEADPLWGMYTRIITKKDINALLNGKILYTDVNNMEYALTLYYKEKEEKKSDEAYICNNYNNNVDVDYKSCGRLIDADALKEIIDMECAEEKVTSPFAFFFKVYIDKAPTVEVGRPHGEWLVLKNGNRECSLCHHEKQDGWHNFCGYCGAEMAEGGDDE